ncbi:enoyl-CoA hydratase/isomerase family protein [Salipiger sp. P9]|uniref:enoyl-CoA hydratase/isomerase family protein n=1 Tax=Salipiger pentaromativorans TaxID=2943193 RepID=UPI002156FB64|nr:enoyl-CoA hydratase/isomerase family protein [Salipiger pentaromativorans]MCR8549250.1 enoyl-CoA hydratase/isomerase family protein [Salipiger pentaromativorans]
MTDHRFRALEISQDGQVATIRILPLRDTLVMDDPVDVHTEMPRAIEQLRLDNSVRIVVLTGAYDGEFLVPPPNDYYTSERATARLGDPYGIWNVSNGMLRCCQALTEIEKPVIAKLNGDAIGFGQSIALGCDLILAREDAVISDAHLGMSEVVTSGGRRVGLPFATVPGDGAGALMPLFMPPTKAKEYMMLSRSYTAAELAQMNIVNRAVPAAELDAVTDEVIAALLKRSAFALAWTKRIMNRHVAQQANLTLDAAVAYEALNFSQIQHLGYDGDPRSLTEPQDAATAAKTRG